MSIDDVIDQELILFVTLNINKNTEPVRALGKMLLQNLQLVVGKRYESEDGAEAPEQAALLGRAGRVRAVRLPELRADPEHGARHEHRLPVLDAMPAATACRSAKGFQQDVSSAPGTTMLLQTRDEETAKYFKQASAQIPVQKRTQQFWRKRFPGIRAIRKDTACNRAGTTGIPGP